MALRWRPGRPLLVSHLAIFALTPYVVGFAIPLPTPVLAAFSLVALISIIVANTLWETVLQSAVPNETLSRVSSYDWAVSLVFMPLGFALWGPLSEWIGIDDDAGARRGDDRRREDWRSCSSPRCAACAASRPPASRAEVPAEPLAS